MLSEEAASDYANTHCVSECVSVRVCLTVCVSDAVCVCVSVRNLSELLEAQGSSAGAGRHLLDHLPDPVARQRQAGGSEQLGQLVRADGAAVVHVWECQRSEFRGRKWNQCESRMKEEAEKEKEEEGGGI